MSRCPDSKQLRSYVVGALADSAQAAVVGDHLEGCADCQAAAQGFDLSDDALIKALRHGARGASYVEEEPCQEVIRSVGAIANDPTTSSRWILTHPDTSPTQNRRIGQYELLEELGRGGMGTVYKALHTQLDKLVALKILSAERLMDPTAVRRFQREMKAVGKLAHSNIVAAMDAGMHEGLYYLVMEFVDGMDLSHLVHRLGPLPYPDASEVIRQTALGLQHAADRGLVHRDIKPSNLMLCRGEDGGVQVKILDMGLARLEESAPGGALTTTGQLMGTVDYMAPEQAASSRDVDIRADIYSLGATLFKLLCGRSPFDRAHFKNVVARMKALTMRAAPPIGDFCQAPQELTAIVSKMLAREPGDRYAQPAELAAALVPLTEGCNLSDLLEKTQAAEKGEE